MSRLHDPPFSPTALQVCWISQSKNILEWSQIKYAKPDCGPLMTKALHRLIVSSEMTFKGLAPRVANVGHEAFPLHAAC